MNKILCFTFILMFTPLTFASAAKSPTTLEQVEALKVPSASKEIKEAYILLEKASQSLEKKDDEKLVIAILKGYAKVSKKEESLAGLEAFAPYFKKHQKKVTELANKHLSKDEAEAVLFGLNAMAENVGAGNDPSVKN